jgi:hypothetical protein
MSSRDGLDVLDLASTDGIGELHGDAIRQARSVRGRLRASISLAGHTDLLDVERL